MSMKRSWEILIGALLFVSVFAIADEEVKEETKHWKHNSELAFSLSSGNSSTTTANAKQSTSYSWARNLIRLDASYLYTIASGVEAAKSYTVDGRYERGLSEKLSLFVANGWQGNRFAGFDYRTTADLGAQYSIIGHAKADTYLISEAGYRYQYEQRLPGAVIFVVNSHIFRVYLEANKKLSPDVTANFFVELLPDLSNSKNFQFNFQPSLAVALGKHLSLKVSYLGRYDGQPAAATVKKFDGLFTTALVATY